MPDEPTPPVVEDSAAAMAALLGTKVVNDDGTPVEDVEEDAGDAEEETEEQKEIAALKAERDKFKALSKNNEKAKLRAQARLRSLQTPADGDPGVHTDDQDEDDDRQVAEDSTLRQENLRLKVALAKGLTVKQAARLSGDTEEEMLADADDYLKDMRPKTRPLGKADGGTGPVVKTPTPVDDWVAALGKALGQ